ncbi:hypothetical protein EPH_0021060 [Eimeria praecox]|uniref:Uncharacterized protein n=1 Tax=Eimeria praecox TaxID=51316 RepID=U6H7J3_9EIME|nr:hypothetical protein EPH_0021060 [Eimeria praecox]
MLRLSLGGGETTILSDLQKELPFKTDSAGRFVADQQCVVYSCKAETGNALLFYHTQARAVEHSAAGSIAILAVAAAVCETAVFVVEPLFTSPADKKAFTLWQEAQLLAEKGETDRAAQLFRQMTKASPELAHYYGM